MILTVQGHALIAAVHARKQVGTHKQASKQSRAKGMFCLHLSPRWFLSQLTNNTVAQQPYTSQMPKRQGLAGWV